MDFETVARDVGYKVFTTEFDVVRDIRQAVEREDLELACQVAENYMRVDPRGADAVTMLTGTRADSVELDKAVAEMEETVSRAIAETGVDPAETVLAFLIDNSGSVRDIKALYARAMARVCGVLDGFGFDTPVVGHTTTEWKGGESRKKWIEAGRHYDAGRLNDMLITVYKQPGEPTLDGDLRVYGLNAGIGSYKENIDGEAIAWLATQLDQLTASHKSLIFVSDGDFPCDDSTLAVNPADYLMRHRNAVIREIEENSDISLVQVVATTADKVGEPNSGMPRFGGRLGESSELVRSITAAVDHALRMKPAPALTTAVDGPKI